MRSTDSEGGGGSGILGKLRTKVPKSSMRQMNFIVPCSIAVLVNRESLTVCANDWSDEFNYIVYYGSNVFPSISVWF